MSIPEQDPATCLGSLKLIHSTSDNNQQDVIKIQRCKVLGVERCAEMKLNASIWIQNRVLRVLYTFRYREPSKPLFHQNRRNWFISAQRSTPSTLHLRKILDFQYKSTISEASNLWTLKLGTLNHYLPRGFKLICIDLYWFTASLLVFYCFRYAYFAF